MNQEMEIKLRCGAGDFDRVAEHLRLIGQIEPLSESRQVDRYLDTADGQLRRAGLAARVRERGARRRIDIKPVPIIPSIMMTRAEFTRDLGPGQSESQALRSLLQQELALLLTDEAGPVLEIVNARRRWMFRAPDLEAKLCLDDVEVGGIGTNGVGDEHRFWEIEIELTKGNPASLARLGVELTSLESIAPSRRSKYQRARSILGLPPFHQKIRPPRFNRDAPVHQVVQGYCKAQLGTVRAFETGTRLGLDPEQLHKMRVATRRLRAALKTASIAFDGPVRDNLREELRWLAGLLGAVRDLDVLQLRVLAWRTRFAAPEEAWERLEEALETRWQRARRDLSEALDSGRYTELLTLADAAFHVKARDDAPMQPIGAALPGLLKKPIKRFRSAIRQFEQTHTTADAHRVRIEGKGLRYAMELFGPLFEVETRRAVTRLANFQDALGELQDSAQAVGLAQDLAEEHLRGGEPNTAYLFLLGEISGASKAHIADAPDVVEAAMKDLKGLKLLKTLKKQAAAIAEACLV